MVLGCCLDSLCHTFFLKHSRPLVSPLAQFRSPLPNPRLTRPLRPKTLLLRQERLDLLQCRRARITTATEQVTVGAKLLNLAPLLDIGLPGCLEVFAHVGHGLTTLRTGNDPWLLFSDGPCHIPSHGLSEHLAAGEAGTFLFSAHCLFLSEPPMMHLVMCSGPTGALTGDT